mmetsp:Transcript_11877/g.21706  ORF Transcript_11877/g.21706 Transcript_11877/m.21706 type:complete len:599 (+) Transcript_11877:79-1875(+)
MAATEPPQISIAQEFCSEEAKRRLHEEFAAAQPYPHMVLRGFLGEPARQLVRSDLEKVRADEKETDLFHFFQTKDLVAACGAAASAASSGPKAREKKGPARRTRGAKRRRVQAPVAISPEDVPSLAALISLFKSSEFKELCQGISQCGPLSEQVDLSSQIYPHGGHLLCHDDVIGTRKISFIYYLSDTDPAWSVEEGGALELYPREEGLPAAMPSAELLPAGDSLALFVVEPGVSFHSVREVLGRRARVSIQGWLHAPSLEETASYAHRDQATLHQLIGQRKPSGEIPRSPTSRAGSIVQPPTYSEKEEGKLSSYITHEYLEASNLSRIAKQFADESQVVLSSFLRPESLQPILEALASADDADGCIHQGAPSGPPNYTAGVSADWKIVGPPHLRRHLALTGLEGTVASAGEAGDLASRLRALVGGLFSTSEFRSWLHAATQVEPLGETTVQVRRFRPGMDYTVAVRPEQTLPTDASLDVVLTLVGDTSADAIKKWESEEVGGFESYIAADEEETTEVQETYRAADNDGPLINLAVAPNTLAMVLRDAQTLRFTKYVGHDAPSSRLDVSLSVPAELPGSDDSESLRAEAQADKLEEAN